MWSLLALMTTVPSVPLPLCFQSQLAEVGIEVEIKSMEKMEWYARYMNPAGWDITAMTAEFLQLCNATVLVLCNDGSDAGGCFHLAVR